MTDDQDDDDRPTHDEIRERYGWKEGEREQVEREQAQRRREIERAEMLAWCERQNIGAESVVTKSAPVTQPRAAAAAPASQEWQSYIEGRIQRESRASEEAMVGAIRIKLDKSNAAMLKAIADVVIKEEKARQQADAETMARLDEINARIDELATRIATLEASAKTAPLRAVG